MRPACLRFAEGLAEILGLDHNVASNAMSVLILLVNCVVFAVAQFTGAVAGDRKVEVCQAVFITVMGLFLEAFWKIGQIQLLTSWLEHFFSNYNAVRGTSTAKLNADPKPVVDMSQARSALISKMRQIHASAIHDDPLFSNVQDRFERDPLSLR